MAKQAKMKKGSIGKKALAAILAASMVLSSSAFSVLAADIMPTDLGDSDLTSVKVEVEDQLWGGADGYELTDPIVSVSGTINSIPGQTLNEYERGVDNGAWTYEVLNAAGSTDVTRDINAGEQETTIESDWRNCKNEKPHIHIRLHYSGTNALNDNSMQDGTVVAAPYDILAVNLADVDKEAKWEKERKYIYDGTYPYSVLEDVILKTRTEKGFDLGRENFDVVPSSLQTTKPDDNDKKWNQVGVYDVDAVAKANKPYSGTAGSTYLEIAPARLNSGLVSVSVKPVTKKDNTADMIEEIESKVKVHDDVLMDGDEVIGQTLKQDTDYRICFQDASGHYDIRNNVWYQGVPSDTLGDHTFAVVALDGCRNFEAGSYIESTYTVLPDNDLGLIVANGKLENFDKLNSEGMLESVYNGKDQYPMYSDGKTKLTLKEGSTTLKEGKDYLVVGPKVWKDADTYTLTIRGIGEKYSGQTAKIKAVILPKPLYKTAKDGKLDTSVYTVELVQSKRGDGKYGDIFPQIKWANEVLNEDVNYSVDITKSENNDKVVELEIKGLKNYTTEWANGNTVEINTTDNGSIFRFEDHLTDLNDSCIEVTFPREISWRRVVNGRIELTDKDINVIDRSSENPVLKLGTHYQIVGGNAVAYTGKGTGTVTMEIIGTGQLSDRKGKDVEGYCRTHARSVSFNIVGDEFGSVYEADDIDPIPYDNGNKITLPTPRVHKIGEARQYDLVEYQYFESDGTTPVPEDGDQKPYITEIGEYVVKINSAEPQYIGTIEKRFRVVGEEIGKLAKAEIVSGSSLVYNGSEQAPEIKVSLIEGGTVLNKDVDYTVKGAVNAGAAVAIVEGLDPYSGTIEVPFTITPASIDGADVTAEKQAFSENPAVAVKIGETVLEAGKDYTITSCTQNADGKTATVTVTGNGNYTGTASAAFEIEETGSVEPTPTPPAETIKTPTFTPSRLKKVKKSFTVTTCKVSGATEWEVEYSLKKSMKGSKTRTYSSNKNSRLYRQAVKCNKSGKTYYIRVRAYVDGKCSDWSPIKSVKSR